ncbi:MAG: hypothetical protein N2Z40_05990 [Caldimicrobium sp.]|nr:hypothetical protein [Caldimicrobium sp.]
MKRFSEEGDLGDDVRKEAFFFRKGDLFFRDQRELRANTFLSKHSLLNTLWKLTMCPLL